MMALARARYWNAAGRSFGEEDFVVGGPTPDPWLMRTGTTQAPGWFARWMGPLEELGEVLGLSP